MRNLDIAFRTYLGNHKGEGGDSFLYDNNLFVLADGLGGEYLDKIATDITCKVINDSFARHLSENRSPAEALIYALEQANTSILQERKKLGEKMAASVSVVYLKDNIMYFTHLGDSRIYSLHDGEINQLTKDHAIFSEDLFSNRKFGNPRLIQSLTAGIGIYEKIEVMVKKYPLHKKGLIILTTEGLTSRISNREILWLSHKTTNPEILCDELIKLAKKKGSDTAGNISVGIIRFGRLPRIVRSIILTYALLFLIIVFAIAGYYFIFGESSDSLKKVDLQLQAQKTPMELTGDEKLASLNDQKVIQQIEMPPTKEEVVNEEKLFDEIYAFIDDWKNAWEKSAGNNGNIDRYLSFYSEKFRTGMFDINRWKKDKSAKNRTKEWIKLDISNMKVSFYDYKAKAEVNFMQKYNSSNYSFAGSKKLILEKEKSEWKIISEISE